MPQKCTRFNVFTKCPFDVSVLNKLKKLKHAGVKQTENETSEYFIYKYLRAQPNGMQSKVKQPYEV